jgi:hypothetical protein
MVFCFKTLRGVTRFGLAGYEFALFVYVMVFFFVAGNATAIQRGVKTRRRSIGKFDKTYLDKTNFDTKTDRQFLMDIIPVIQ